MLTLIISLYLYLCKLCAKVACPLFPAQTYPKKPPYDFIYLIMS